MSNEAIRELIFGVGKKAADLTKGLKDIGSGSMQDGLREMASYYYNEGIIEGERQGIAKGALGVLLATGIVFIVVKHVESVKKHRQEGEEIISRLNQSSEENCKTTSVSAIDENENRQLS